MGNGQLVELGFCNKPHGIKGGFSFCLQNQEESVLQNGSLITLYPQDSLSRVDVSGETFVIKDISFGNKVIVYLENVSDRNEVEAMIPFVIKLDRDIFPEISQDEYYINDLIGMVAINPITKKKLGVIDSSYNNGAQDILIVKLVSGKSVDIPFVEQFFKDIDLDENVVEVILPEVVG